jgi:hypothetical protein
MTQSMCDHVAERLALGEELGELAEHAATCASCQGLVAVSGRLGATRHAVDPGLGFSARMTVGAQHRLAVRRRHRFTAGLAATVATGMFGVFIVAHNPSTTEPTTALPAPARSEPPRHAPNPWDDAKPSEADQSDPALSDLAQLAQSGDYAHAMDVGSHWGRIKKPLAPYKKLLKGVVP